MSGNGLDRRDFLMMASGMLAIPAVSRCFADDTSGTGSFLDLSQCVVPEKFKDHPLFTTPHCGVNFGFLARRGYFSMPEIRRQPKLIRESGANWVTLNTHFCQERYSSTRVFLDFDWSSGERELVDMINALHDEGLHVILKPCLTSLDSAWMGSVTFPGWNEHQIEGVTQTYCADWFKSLRECLSYFSDIAEEHGVEALMAGAEYNGTTHFNEHWRKTLAHVRTHYHGPVTYEFMPEEPAKKSLSWFNDLDFLSLSTYPSGVDVPDSKRYDFDHWKDLPPISKETMMSALSKHAPLVESFSKRFGNKPLVFSEIGTRSCRGCVNVPGDYWHESIWDGREQADYMEAAYSVFSKLPCWLGLSWWKWDETQHNRPHYSPDPLKDRGFTIYGKPACEVFKKWSRSGISF